MAVNIKGFGKADLITVVYSNADVLTEMSVDTAVVSGTEYKIAEFTPDNINEAIAFGGTDETGIGLCYMHITEDTAQADFTGTVKFYVENSQGTKKIPIRQFSCAQLNLGHDTTIDKRLINRLGLQPVWASYGQFLRAYFEPSMSDTIDVSDFKGLLTITKAVRV